MLTRSLSEYEVKLEVPVYVNARHQPVTAVVLCNFCPSRRLCDSVLSHESCASCHQRPDNSKYEPYLMFSSSQKNSPQRVCESGSSFESPTRLTCHIPTTFSALECRCTLGSGMALRVLALSTFCANGSSDPKGLRPSWSDGSEERSLRKSLIHSALATIAVCCTTVFRLLFALYNECFIDRPRVYMPQKSVGDNLELIVRLGKLFCAIGARVAISDTEHPFCLHLHRKLGSHVAAAPLLDME